MQRSVQDLLLGLVFFGGLGLLLWATSELTDLSFQPRPRLEVRFAEAGGVRKGDAVFVLGTPFGEVESIGFDPSAESRDRITMVLLLKRELILRSDMAIRVSDSGLLGNKRIEVDPGIAADPWPESEILRGTVRPDALAQLSQLLDESEGSTIDRLFKDDALYVELTAAAASARKTLEELEKGESTLGRLAYDAELGQRFDNIVRDLESVADKLDQGTGTLGRLISDDELGTKVDSAITNFDEITRKINAGEGTLGRLINDSELADKVDSAITNIDATFALARDPEAGVIGALVADTALREKVTNIVDDIEGIVDEIRNGNGLLARLINDEDLGREFERLITQVSRAIEDAREAAPIGTFFQVFAGAF